MIKQFAIQSRPKDGVVRYVKNIIIGIGLCICAYGIVFAPHVSEAATLYMRPSASSVSVGDIVSVRFLVNTDGKYINTANAIVNFPTDMFDVVSTSKSSSIFPLWVDGPRFSNPEGKIIFDGGVPSPGYTGGAGEVVAVTFRAKKAGTATLIFSGASVRENDGMGTDVLTSSPSAVIQIVPAKTPAVTEPANAKPVEDQKPAIVTKVAVPAKPTVRSSTHPEQDRWYTATTAMFGWDVPPDVISVQASLDNKSLDNPTVTYDGSVSSKTLNNLDDGVYYFNLRYKNSIGKSPTDHFVVRVDSTAPELTVPVVSVENGRNIVTLNATDSMSGLAYYELRIDSQPAFRIKPSHLVEGKFVFDPQIEGTHTLSVLAVDEAGNSIEEKISFSSPGITPPKISVSDEKLELGDDVVIHGSSVYSGAKIKLTIKFEGGKTEFVEEQMGVDGTFDITLNDINTRGTIKVVGNILFANDVVSGLSNELTLYIGGPQALRTFAALAYPILGIVLVVLLTMACVFLIYLGWLKFFKLRTQFRSDFQILAASTQNTLNTIKRELTRQLHILKRIKQDRKLTDIEQEIFEDIRKRIDDVDAFIQERISKHL